MSAPPQETGWSTFRVFRTGVLSVLLISIGAWAFTTQNRRRLRTEWDRPLRTGVVFLQLGDVDERELTGLMEALPALQQFLAAERARWGEGAEPFELEAFGPVRIPAAPPLPSGDGLVSNAWYAWDLSRFLDPLNAQAGFNPRAYDLRIYVVIEEEVGATQRVEGIGALGGDLGLVRVTLAATMIDPALIAIGHELLHCVGATDKYDAAGHAIDPDGLAEPELDPRYPQRFAELMVGEIPEGPGRGRFISSLSEVQVGALTALEIGWRSAE